MKIYAATQRCSLFNAVKEHLSYRRKVNQVKKPRLNPYTDAGCSFLSHEAHDSFIFCMAHSFLFPFKELYKVIFAFIEFSRLFIKIKGEQVPKDSTLLFLLSIYKTSKCVKHLINHLASSLQIHDRAYVGQFFYLLRFTSKFCPIEIKT